MPKHCLVVEAIVFDAVGRVLLVKQRRRRGGRWELPGGKVKNRESLPDAVERETFEETSVPVSAGSIQSIFHIRDEHTHDFVWRCSPTDARATPTPDPKEVSAAGWFPVETLPAPMMPFTARLIRSARARPVLLRVISLKPDDWLGSE